MAPAAAPQQAAGTFARGCAKPANKRRIKPSSSLSHHSANTRVTITTRSKMRGKGKWSPLQERMGATNGAINAAARAAAIKVKASRRVNIVIRRRLRGSFVAQASSL